jgi:hypothetical protein
MLEILLPILAKVIAKVDRGGFEKPSLIETPNLCGRGWFRR